MSKTILSCCLAVTLGHVCLGQRARGDDKQPARAQASALLSALPDQIKAIEEPTLRVSLRLRLMKLLWSRKSEGSAEAAEALAAQAAQDVQDHPDEISKSYQQLFRRELMAAMELNAPALAARVKGEWGKSGIDDFDTAYELLKLEGGAARAAEIARGGIRVRHDLTSYGLQSFLSRLDETSPEVVSGLLSEMLGVVEAAPEEFPVAALFTLAHNYLYRPATPTPLKARFLGVLIRASANPTALSAAERGNAFIMLKANLPTIETLLPSLYAQANAETAALLPLLPKQDVERGDVYNRIRGGGDALERAVDEAEKTQDAALKTELLNRAAQLALDAGKFRQAVDLVMKADEAKGEERLAQRDQFLSTVAQKAAQKKDAEALAYAAARIDAPLERAAALQRLALLQNESGDAPRVRDTLAEALKLIEGADDGARKATSMLVIVNTFLKIDGARAAELLPSVIKSVNNIPGPGAQAARGSEARQKHVETMMQIAYYLPPLFERLVQQDELATLGFADRLQRQELKVSALLGAFNGLDRSVVRVGAGAKSN